MELPAEFVQRMRELLGEEADEFLNTYQQDSWKGLRVNSLKITREKFLEKNPFHLESVPWCREGFYYEQSERPGRHPWHEAGAYYIQEPSAMSAVELLEPRPGEWILDLCAAPGGKSSQIAAAMQGQGLLVSNEIHPARAKILSQNMERMGAANVLVLNESPDRLAERFAGCFDRILCDAPCSGEGMFRKDEEARGEWSQQQVEICADRQLEILGYAAEMLRPGGRMVYSTCTFSVEENEELIARFLESHSEFSLINSPKGGYFARGRADWISPEKKDKLCCADQTATAYRLWPHLIKGEGHFAAVFCKSGDAAGSCKAISSRKNRNDSDKKTGRKNRKTGFEMQLQLYEAFEKEVCREKLCGRHLLFGSQLYLVPEEMPDLDGLKVMRPGLHLGTFGKDVFKPAHALAMALKPEQVYSSVDYAWEAEEICRYLKGETFSREGEKGWTLIAVDGMSLGWGKQTGSMMKNHYPKGLRVNW